MLKVHKLLTEVWAEGNLSNNWHNGVVATENNWKNVEWQLFTEPLVLWHFYNYYFWHN